MLRIIVSLLLGTAYKCSALYSFRKLNHRNMFSSPGTRSLDQFPSPSVVYQSNNDDTNSKKSNSLVLKHISLLTAIWQKIHALSQDTDGDVVDEDDDYSDFILSEYYGSATESSRNRIIVDGVIKHFQFSKDTCAADGAFLMATQNNANQDVLRLSRVILNKNIRSCILKCCQRKHKHLLIINTFMY